MHYHSILLVQAETLADAKIIARDFCENECGEHAYFDYGDIVPDNETEWNKPLNEVKDKLPVEDHLAEAERLTAQASEALEKQQYEIAGRYYRKAGELYSQCFCTEHQVYNIQCYDYSYDYGEGWYAIEADLHF
ncbi:MAG: hypothetical protein LBH44_01870 [Treponema sp.]|jgi:hypothetical protein|nr:hypothetical protein [Treponema sp.]